MKNILLLTLLAFTSLALSQENNPITVNGITLYPLTGEELDRIYERDMQGQFCADDLDSCKEVAGSLRNVVSDLNKEIQEGKDQLEKLAAEKETIQQEKEKLIAEKATLEAKRDKRFGIGVNAGMGIDLKPYVGIGVSYDIFKF